MQLPEVGEWWDLGPKYAIQIMVWIIYQVVTRERGAPVLAQDDVLSLSELQFTWL